MFSELVKRNSRRSRRENGLFFTSLLIAIIAFYIILSLSHQDVMVFLQRMESNAVNRLLTLVPVLYGLTLFILFFLVYYANRFQLARRRHEFGVYLMLGMQRRKLFGMLLAEDLRSSLIALAIGLPAAVLISEVISLVTARLVGLGIVGHRFALSLPAIGWTAVGYPHLIALSGYNRLLAAAGLPELTLADDEAAVYCDSEVSLASRTALINRLIAEDSAITIDGAPFTLVGQVQSVSVVTDRSITMLFALIVPDAAFEHYTQGDYDVYLDGVLAPSMTEGKSLMNAIADMNALLNPLGLKYESYLQNLGRELFYIVAASYLTIYLAIIFLVVANTIIGVQFLMGQQKAARRYRTLVRLGAEHDTLCRAAKAQINWYFGLPVGVAAVSSLFGVRALFSGILSASAQSGMTEMMIAAGAMILLLCVIEWIYMAAVKRSSSKYLLTLMAPEREE